MGELRHTNVRFTKEDSDTAQPKDKKPFKPSVTHSAWLARLGAGVGEHYLEEVEVGRPGVGAGEQQAVEEGGPHIRGD